MKLRFRFGLVCLLLITQVLNHVPYVNAARGAPGKAEFGIGAILYPQGPLVKEALAMAVDLNLDWMKVPVYWDFYQPNSGEPPWFDTLDVPMEFAARNHIAVLLSVTRAPQWARSSQGPDPEETARFVLELVRRYPQAVQAVELFPGANTRAGWGGKPDAAAYFSLFSRVNAQIKGASQPVILVAAGLQPLRIPAPTGDIDDLEFLKELYQQGALQEMPVISMQYKELTGDPLVYPDGSEHRVFRHYEEVRRVMIENHHKNGLIWITHLSLPSGTISIPDSTYHDINAQTSWLSQAYIQTRSQLYVGVTIGQSLNPEPEGVAEGVSSLLKSMGGHHPFYSVLREMISLNNAGGATIKPGRAKEGSFLNKQP